MAIADEYLTLSQASKKLSMTRQTLSRWIREGKILGEKVGREVLIHKDSLPKPCPTCGQLIRR